MKPKMEWFQLGGAVRNARYQKRRSLHHMLNTGLWLLSLKYEHALFMFELRCSCVILAGSVQSVRVEHIVRVPDGHTCRTAAERVRRDQRAVL